MKMICIKSENIRFPILNINYATIINKEYLIYKSSIENNGKHYYFVFASNIVNLKDDMALCDINNFITLAEYRDKRINEILE